MIGLALTGRIDSLSSGEIRKQLSDLVLEGHRSILVNMERIQYMSSAGLRVLIESQKQIKAAGGDIILAYPTPTIMELLQLSGFEQIFRVVRSPDELDPPASVSSEVQETREIGGITLSCIRREALKGSLSVIGAQAKLARSEYGEGDAVTVYAREMPYGTGLATLGNAYPDYKDCFGEALVINRHLFYYPAVERPAVDMMLCLDQRANPEYKFLHGFAFQGDFSYLLSFEGKDRFLEITALVDALLELSAAPILGLVLLGESKGFWGMNLRQAPILENQPKNADIFSSENFPEWLDFPVEPSSINHVVAACGIAVRDKKTARSEIQELLPGDSRFHLHAAVFSKEPLKQQAGRLEKELNRVLTQLEPQKVQHVLSRTQFSSGLAGIIEIGE